MMLKHRTKFSGQKGDSRLHLKPDSPVQLRWIFFSTDEVRFWPENQLLWEMASWKVWPIATAVGRVLTSIFCIYRYCSILGCHKTGFHIVLKTGRVVILFHIPNLNKRPLSGKTVWPWKIEMRSWVIFNGIPSNAGLWLWGCCMHERPSPLCTLCPAILLSG